MELEYYVDVIAKYLPAGNQLTTQTEFMTYITNNGPFIVNQISDFMMMTLPSPRVSYYENNDYFKIQSKVTGYAD